MLQQWTGCFLKPLFWKGIYLLSLSEARGHPGPVCQSASLPGPRGTRGGCCGVCQLWAVEVGNFMWLVKTEGSSTEGASPKGLLSQLHGPSQVLWLCLGVPFLETGTEACPQRWPAGETARTLSILPGNVWQILVCLSRMWVHIQALRTPSGGASSILLFRTLLLSLNRRQRFGSSADSCAELF